MKTFSKFFIILAALIVPLLACSGTPSGGSAFSEGGALVWSDEFEGDSLDLSKWNTDTGTGKQYGLDGWGNEESQFYKAENAIVKDGVLYLEVRKDNDEENLVDGRFTFPYTSAKVTTGGIMNHDGTVHPPKFTVKPGMRIEARLKTPRGIGFWPAFWLIGATTNEYGGEGVKKLGWPRCGEIDILEMRGGIENRLNSAIHFGPYWPENRSEGNYLDLGDGNMADEWHVYGVTWDANALHFLFDGEAWHTIDLKQLNKDSKEFYIKEAYGAATGFIININLAVGGHYISKRLPADEVFEEDAPYEDRCFMIDWVRVYQR
ncbi:MAG: glycoside hydrolase family 16 protein [Treponema sp.]|nr:glycoside hydrolase family 16 protein [Treponema sp.]